MNVSFWTATKNRYLYVIFYIFRRDNNWEAISKALKWKLMIIAGRIYSSLVQFYGRHICVPLKDTNMAWYDISGY